MFHVVVRIVLPNLDQLPAVNLEGGSNTLSSGGFDLGTVDGDSQLVSREFRTRNLRAVNDTQYPLRYRRNSDPAGKEIMLLASQSCVFIFYF